ncbi:MAG: signal peptidase I [Clostridia bacterium]|nr:signal peptidase I [Clostridia bacterium]
MDENVMNGNNPEEPVEVIFTEEDIESAVEDSFFDAKNEAEAAAAEAGDEVISNLEKGLAAAERTVRDELDDGEERLDADVDNDETFSEIMNLIASRKRKGKTVDEPEEDEEPEEDDSEENEEEQPKTWLGLLVHAKKGDKLYVLHEIISYILIFAIAFVAAIFINIYIFRISNVVGSSMKQTFHDGQTVFLSRLPYIFGSPQHGDVVIFDSHGDERTFAKDWNDAIKSNAIVKLFKKTTVTNEDEHDFYIKRVIGVAGDAIRIHDGKVWRAKISDLGSEYTEVVTLYDEYSADPSSEGGQRYMELWQAIANLPLDGTVWEALDEPYVNPNEVPKYDSWEGRCWIVPEKHMFVMGDNRNHSTDGRYFGIRPYNCILGKVLGNH